MSRRYKGPTLLELENQLTVLTRLRDSPQSEWTKEDSEFLYKHRAEELRKYFWRKKDLAWGNIYEFYSTLQQRYYDQNCKCFYTDELLSAHNISVDRIVGDLGYIPGNIVLCTRRANRIKNDQTLEEMKHNMPNWYERIKVLQEGHNNGTEEKDN